MIRLSLVTSNKMIIFGSLLLTFEVSHKLKRHDKFSLSKSVGLTLGLGAEKIANNLIVLLKCRSLAKSSAFVVHLVSTYNDPYLDLD